MTERKVIDRENVKTAEENMADWSDLTYTCPKCGSHKLLKCLGGQVVYALVDEIHYKREERESEDEEDTGACADENTTLEDDIEDAYVLVQSRADGSEIWDFGVDDASEHCCWFRCADCDYVASFEDGSPVQDEMDLARWLIRHCKLSQ